MSADFFRKDRDLQKSMSGYLRIHWKRKLQNFPGWFGLFSFFSGIIRIFFIIHESHFINFQLYQIPIQLLRIQIIVKQEYVKMVELVKILERVRIYVLVQLNILE